MRAIFSVAVAVAVSAYMPDRFGNLAMRASSVISDRQMLRLFLMVGMSRMAKWFSYVPQSEAYAVSVAYDTHTLA